MSLATRVFNKLKCDDGQGLKDTRNCYFNRLEKLFFEWKKPYRKSEKHFIFVFRYQIDLGDF